MSADFAHLCSGHRRRMVGHVLSGHNNFFVLLVRLVVSRVFYLTDKLLHIVFEYSSLVGLGRLWSVWTPDKYLFPQVWILFFLLFSEFVGAEQRKLYSDIKVYRVFVFVGSIF